MQKIRINRDLFTMVDYAKTGFSLRENIVSTSKIVIPSTAFVTGLMAVIDGSYATLSDYFDLLACGSFLYLADFGINTLTSIILRDSNREKANLELLDLATKLSLLDVNTNADLLKDARLLKKQYHFKSENKRVSLVEDKHIEIKVHNGVGKEFEETLLQQHNIGSDSYEISVQSPSKKLVYKFVKRTV